MDSPHADDRRLGARGRWLMLAALFGLALGLRLLYLSEVHDQPFYRHPVVDQAAYDARAQQIAFGSDPAPSLFYQDPLYPYFLAGIYKIFGRSLTAVYVIQAVLTSACVFFLFGMGRRLARHWAAGLTAALAWALYKVDFFYNGQVLKTSVGIFVLCGALWAATVAWEERRRWAAAAAGAGLGLLLLVSGNNFVASLGVTAWLLFSLWRGPGRAGKIAAALVAAGFVLFPGAMVARNYVVAGQLVISTVQGGSNLYIANFAGNEWGTGVSPPFTKRRPGQEQKDFKREAERRTGRTMTASEVSRFWTIQALREMYENPGLTAKREVRKALLLINRGELSDNVCYDFFQQFYSRILRLPLPSFWFAACFGFAGLGWALRKRRGGPAAAFLAVFVLSLLVFYPFGRYRFPLAPPLLVFAGVGLVELGRAWSERRTRAAAAYLAAVLVLGALAFPIWRETNYDLPYAKLGLLYLKEGRNQEAINAFQQALEYNPGLADAWIGLGDGLLANHRLEEAEDAYRRALALDPANRGGHYRLGRLLELRGLVEEGRRELELAGPNQPEDEPMRGDE